MESQQLMQNPFAVLTFIVAPALLTNATSVLALSTINRMLRTRDRMHELFARSKAGEQEEAEEARQVEQVDRVEAQALLLLRALHSIYIALGSFAGATLVTLVGAGLIPFVGGIWIRLIVGLGLLLGFLGVGSLVFSSASLLQATRLSLVNIRQEAALIRERHARRKAPVAPATAARIP